MVESFENFYILNIEIIVDIVVIADIFEIRDF